MTREEAIEKLKNTAWLGSNNDRESTEEAVRMAIEALNLQPTCNQLATTEGDLISREDAIALVIKAIHGTDNKEIQEYLFDGLRKQMWSLPSAEIPTEYTNTSTVFIDGIGHFPKLSETSQSLTKPNKSCEALPSKGQVVLDIDDKETWGDKGTWDVDKQRGW